MKKFHHIFSGLLLFSLILVNFSCGPTGEMDGPKHTGYGQLPVSTSGIDPFFVEPTDTFSPPNNITREVLEDRNGDLWLTTWNGLIRYDSKSFTNITLTKKLKHFHFFSSMRAGNGDLWFGTIGAGVYRYDGNNFSNFSSESGLLNNRIACLMQDTVGNTWIGTDSGLTRYNGAGFVNYTIKNGLCDNAVHTLMQDRSGLIWIGTDNGLCRYDGRSFSSFYLKDSMRFENVRALKQDKKGNIWIGCGEGLFLYDGRSITKITGSFTTYIFEERSGALLLSCGDTATAPAPVPPRIGISTNTRDGMVLYRYDGKRLSKIISKMEINDNQIFGAIEDSKGMIWFGTMQGLCRYDGKSFTYFYKQM
ncbi:MAG TPA: two-component regulator propeller domain-containing protein [Bacteroidia bacterium]|jgi:streptogramin lyase